MIHLSRHGTLPSMSAPCLALYISYFIWFFSPCSCKSSHHKHRTIVITPMPVTLVGNCCSEEWCAAQNLTQPVSGRAGSLNSQPAVHTQVHRFFWEPSSTMQWTGLMNPGEPVFNSWEREALRRGGKPWISNVWNTAPSHHSDLG